MIYVSVAASGTRVSVVYQELAVLAILFPVFPNHLPNAVNGKSNEMPTVVNLYRHTQRLLN
jgi:hypothetical protein